MIVICRNDFPWIILPEKASEDDAQKLCKRLNQNDAAKYPDNQVRVYHHFRDCPIKEPKDV